MSKGTTAAEATRMPLGKTHAEDGTGFDRDDSVYDYQRVPRTDPALRGVPNPNDERNQKRLGWETCCEDPEVTGHDEMVLMRRPKDDPRAVRDRQRQEAADAKGRPNKRKPREQELRQGYLMQEKDGIALGDVGATLESADSVRRERAKNERLLEENPDFLDMMEADALEDDDGVDF